MDTAVLVESESSSDHAIRTENTPEHEESNSKDCTGSTVEAALPLTERAIKDSTDEVKGKVVELKEKLIHDVDNELKQATAGKDVRVDADQSEESKAANECSQTAVSIGGKNDVKCMEGASLNEESTKFSNDVEAQSTVKDQKTLEKPDVCTVIDVDTGDDTNAQCQELIKSLSQTFESKDQSLHDVDADTDLSKLVDGNSEVMVLTVETVPLNDSNETIEEDIVVTVHEKDVIVNSSESKLSGTGKEAKKTEIVKEQFDLIEYSHESDGTIIEVISTEVIHSEVPETCTQLRNKETLKRTTSEVDSVTSTTPEIVRKPELVDNVNREKAQTKCNASRENDVEDVQVQTNDKVRTESCDSSDKSTGKKDLVHSNATVAPEHVDNSKEGSISVNEINKVGAATKKRSVIQDIFDDWGDENADDLENDSQSSSKVQDTVEIELKSLLDDTKTAQPMEDTVVLVEEEVRRTEKEPVTAARKVAEVVKGNKELQISKEQTDNQSIVKEQCNIKSSNKDQVNSPVSQSFGKSLRNTTHDSVAMSQTSSQAKIIPPIIRGRNLISQIATPAEVTEALKERLREKQKIVEAPPGPDIFFVKKLTQRLSSKLAGGPISSLPALIPLPQSTTQSSTHCEKRQTDNVNTETEKESTSDNKELLAILEGDVDPDWSNLKPPTLTEEGRSSGNVEQADHSAPPKLDPLVERELALKQLLELPVTPVKKNPSKKKKTFKPAPIKASNEVQAKSTPETEKEIVNIDLIDDMADPLSKDITPDSESPPMMTEQQISEMNAESNAKDLRYDESRSGRKRKLTEKAREHEEQQSIVKRQKVYKSKVSLNKKQPLENEAQSATEASLTIENHVPVENTLPATAADNEADITITKEVTSKQHTDQADSTSNTPESAPLKRSKQSVSKKGSQPIAKKNLTIKKILKQNMSSSKKAVALKAKLNAPTKKSGSKIVSKSKRSAENSSGDSKPKKKIINEIDRLLQDEGVVNLLYDVEQPDKKRLIPITKSQTKVMDLQKVQRELKIRKKLVRNAVLRLRTSTSGISKVSPRSKRTSIYLSDTQADKKVGEQATLTKPTNVPSQSEFILPAKIRNAADASVIIRRHSSSSFSSASGSPRVSIDSPEKTETVKADEGASHSLRSTKRRHSQEERANVKKSKKKVVQKVDAENTAANTVEDKAKSKKSDSKKVDKNSKQSETTLTDESSSAPGKVITRSNGTTTGKITSKTKKAAKNKVTFAKTSESDNNEEFPKGEDELSACLAEAATALSVVSAGNRSGNSAANRKNKVNTNTTKTSEVDNNKTKIETRSQFSNKEINVRRHGNLVQLILTPSSSLKIRNALTLQVMQEFRETLSILKKDDDCRVVLLTSTGSSFCEGLELSMLLHTSKEERRARAQEIADAVKDFIKSLASFNKPIVAGVQGAAVGLGVTMLPLFDLVIASDKATFSTPYGKLGQIAEGAAVFTLSHILGSAITSELLLGGRTLTASEALRAGLVTRVLWPDRFQVELLPTLKAMGEQSSQSMEATKALLRHSLRKKLDAALESETYLLIQHWCSAECQTAIKAYIDGKVQ
ncbi:uncharacterized protein LOC143377543 isoform X2 [Andrena cerasifolii]|uniref:uncharacterized protein LOC143377543 isoform X2 n=1 Tax=Andrena cerasifolii TaxID=2819439 RepID=UPI0040377B70